MFECSGFRLNPDSAWKRVKAFVSSTHCARKSMTSLNFVPCAVTSKFSRMACFALVDISRSYPRILPGGSCLGPCARRVVDSLAFCFVPFVSVPLERFYGWSRKSLLAVTRPRPLLTLPRFVIVGCRRCVVRFPSLRSSS